MIRPDWPVPARVVAVTTTRVGGVSRGPYTSLNIATHVGDDPAHVLENRRLLRQQLALPAEPCWLQQVHGNGVITLTRGSVGGEADAACTREAGVVCAIQSADCLPVLFCDLVGRQVAAAHAGWAGLLAGVLEATHASFAADAEVIAWLGPAISQRAFEVGPEVRQRYLQAAPQEQRQATLDAFLPSTRANHWMADLYQLARIRLQPLGVATYGGDYCTATDSQRFFSYRRDGKTGRIASLIYINP